MKERIAVNPQIHFGKPCIAGTRIPVQDVLELIREGLSFSDIVRDYYPDLTPEDIGAAPNQKTSMIPVTTRYGGAAHSTVRKNSSL